MTATGPSADRQVPETLVDSCPLCTRHVVMHAPCRRGSPPKRAVPVALGPTQDQTSAAISIRRVARLSRNVGQPDHILANPIISHKAERRPGSGEIWLAVTKHDGVQVDSILIDQAKVGQALRQARAGNSISPSRSAFSSRITPSRLSSTSLALGPTDFNERETTHFGCLRHAAAKACSSASHSG